MHSAIPLREATQQVWTMSMTMTDALTARFVSAAAEVAEAEAEIPAAGMSGPARLESVRMEV
jgi:hypothetical protein